MDEKNAEHRIQLLRVMLVMSPGDTRSHLALLSLLYTAREVEEFVNEARKFQRAHPGDTDSWDRICAMGRELAPFESVFCSSRNWPTEPGGAAFGSTDQEIDGGADECIPIPAVDRRGPDRRRSDRRSGMERRRDDRRETDLAWLGVQRRYGQRRCRHRRQADVVVLYPD